MSHTHWNPSPSRASEGRCIPAALLPRAPARPCPRRVLGNVVNQDMFYRHRQAMDKTMATVPELADEANEAFLAEFGRGYPLVERYRAEEADLLLVCFGSMCGTAR